MREITSPAQESHGPEHNVSSELRVLVRSPHPTTENTVGVVQLGGSIGSKSTPSTQVISDRLAPRPAPVSSFNSCEPARLARVAQPEGDAAAVEMVEGKVDVGRVVWRLHELDHGHATLVERFDIEPFPVFSAK